MRRSDSGRYLFSWPCLAAVLPREIVEAHVTGASRSAGRVVWKAVLTLAAVEALAACGSGGMPLGGSLPPSAPRIDLQSTPVALYDPATGKTTVTLDFLVRDGAGT